MTNPLLRPQILTAALVLGLLVTACSATDDGGPLRVGFVLVGDRHDLGYNQAVWEGADELARALPDIEVLRREDVPEDDRAVDVLQGLVDEGATVLFATSFGHYDAAVEVARTNPGVTVLHQGATPPVAELPNFGTYFGAHSEAAYTAGVAAGHTTTTGRLGFVVAFPIPATYNNVNAFTLGARTVVPDATTLVAFTDDWCDPAVQADVVTAFLLEEDVDVVAQHQDCTATVLELATDLDAAVVGYHADGSEVAGDAWLTGAVWTWGELYEDAVRQVVDGTFADSRYRDGFVGTVADGDNPFVLTEPGPAMGETARRETELVMDGFRGGDPVFVGPLRDTAGELRVPPSTALDQEQIDAMDWFVEGVEVLGDADG